MALRNSQPFPLWLRWALLGPFGFLVAANVLALGGTSEFLKGMWVVAFLAAAVSAIAAVPMATFLILRRGYFSVWNVVMTVVATLPLVFAIGIAFTFKYGHFHI